MSEKIDIVGEKQEPVAFPTSAQDKAPIRDGNISREQID